jgi:Domain of unknown function (DUF222)/HNH endonuclease
MFERPIEVRYAALAAEFAAWLDEVVAFDESGEWQAEGATSMSTWLAGRFGMARGTARELVRVRRALRGLPAIHDGFSRGELSLDQLKPLTRFVNPEEDEDWARRAQAMSPAELRGEVRRRQRVAREEAETLANLRYLWMGWDEDRRMLHLEGELPAEHGAAVEAAIERAAQDIVLEEGPDIRDPEGARLADALVGLVTSGSGGSAQPVVVVHADVATVSGAESSLAETESGVSLATETVQRLACDAVVECVVEAGGTPVGIGRRSRIVPAWLRRHVVFRDRGCRFPGCGHTRWVDAHHIWHWGEGGPTDLDNLVLLCGAHHRLAHERDWTIRGHPGGRLRFHDPTGREAFPRSGPAIAA